MFRISTLICLSALCFLSCQKEDKPTCDYKATVVFFCSEHATDRYTGKVDGNPIGDFTAGGAAPISVDTGCHMLSAGAKNDYICLKPCETAYFFFP